MLQQNLCQNSETFAIIGTGILICNFIKNLLKFCVFVVIGNLFFLNKSFIACYVCIWESLFYFNYGYLLLFLQVKSSENHSPHRHNNLLICLCSSTRNSRKKTTFDQKAWQRQLLKIKIESDKCSKKITKIFIQKKFKRKI